MLTLYRRHKRTCEHRKDQKRRGTPADEKTSCKCPIYIQGTVDSEPTRKSLDTDSWTAAEREKRKLEEGQPVEPPKKKTVQKALADFIKDCESRNLNGSTLKKYRGLSTRLGKFADKHRIDALADMTTSHVREFRNSLKFSPRTALKELERIKGFFKFCVESDWITKNPAKPLKAPKVDANPTQPFSEAEQNRIRAQAISLARGEGKIPADPRLPTFIDLLIETGLRIRAAGLLNESQIIDGKLILPTAKSRGAKVVWMPLSPTVLQGLQRVKPKGGYYFVNSDSLKPATVAEYWRVRVKRVCAKAGLPKAHPHQFRDTASVNWLVDGVDIPKPWPRFSGTRPV